MIVPVIVCVYMCACGFVGARVHAPVNLSFVIFAYALSVQYKRFWSPRRGGALRTVADSHISLTRCMHA